MFNFIKDKWNLTLSLFWQSAKSFSKNNSLSVAASLAYYSLFALIPLLLLLFFTLSFFITSSQTVMNRITTLFAQFIPYYSNVILKEVYTLARDTDIWGILTIGALLWAAMPLMGTLRSVFSEIFKVEEKASFLKTKLLDMSVILLTLSLFVIVSFSNIVLKKFLVFYNSAILYNIASYILTAIVLSIFYIVFVPVRISLKYILIGAICATFLLGIIRPLFGLFITYNPRYGITFGSLKALFVIIIWIYYSFSVLLFSAEVIANLRRRDVLLLKGLFYETYIDKKLERLKKRFGKTYNTDEVIFKEGEKGDEMFYVLTGSVMLTKRDKVVKIMKKNDYFGEMALLIGTPRTVSAYANEDETILIPINKDNFEALLKEEPKIAISFLREFARKLKTTDESIR